METILFYNVEATAKPEWKLSSDHEDQPHLTKLAALLVNSETLETIQTLDLIIKPDGFESDIPLAYDKNAIPEGFATMLLYLMWNGSKRVTYDKAFNQKLVKTAMSRFLQQEPVDLWKSKKDHICIKKLTTKDSDVKNPSLVECASHFVNENNILQNSFLDNLVLIKDIYFASQI